jgi:uncharacterized protein (DUF1697 family)
MGRCHVGLLYSVILSQTQRVTKAQLHDLARHAKSGFVATVLSTGNLILQDDDDPADLEKRLEAATLPVLGKSIAVFVRDDREFRALVDANPLPQETLANPARVGVRLLRESPAQEALDRITAKMRPGERFVAQDRALWLATPDDLSKSPLLAAVNAPWVGEGTLRSASAMAKIAALAELSAVK